MNIHEKLINVFGVPVVLARKQDVVLWCKKRITANIKTRVVTANPEILLQARSDAWYHTVVRTADLVTPDGAGVCWAAVFWGLADQSRDVFDIIKLFVSTLWEVVFGNKNSGYFPERVSGSDLLWDIAKLAEQLNKKVYLIGGENGTAQRAAMRIKGECQNLNIQAFGLNHVATPYSVYSLHNEIENFQPDIIFVAYGSPKQEEWINQNMHRYSSIGLAMGVGGALDFIAGNTVRAPLRLQNHALEWFWRLYQRPSRFIRVFRAIIVFPVIILISQLKKFYARKI
ncbi:MAG: WecB/TagA/CpsF family glycosyltransferase [bacterium]|nr:WecB/TagA/CpsF family glycosyltransferase [bacterium]